MATMEKWIFPVNSVTNVCSKDSFLCFYFISFNDFQIL